LGCMANTAKDGTFRLGPLSQQTFFLTGFIGEPRRLGHATAKANASDVVIQLQPEKRQ